MSANTFFWLPRKEHFSDLKAGDFVKYDNPKSKYHEQIVEVTSTCYYWSDCVLVKLRTGSTCWVKAKRLSKILI